MTRSRRPLRAGRPSVPRRVRAAGGSAARRAARRGRPQPAVRAAVCSHTFLTVPCELPMTATPPPPHTASTERAGAGRAPPPQGPGGTQATPAGAPGTQATPAGAPGHPRRGPGGRRPRPTHVFWWAR